MTQRTLRGTRLKKSSYIWISKLVWNQKQDEKLLMHVEKRVEIN